MNSAAGIYCGEPQAAEVPLLHSLGGGRSRNHGVFSVALCHHGPPESDENLVVTLSNWPHVSKFLQTNEVRLFIHGHGHQRKALRQNLTNGSKSTRKGRLTKDQVLRVMGPTTHLKQEKRPDGAGRGFSLITLDRSGGSVETAEIDSYKLDDERPGRMARDEFRF